MFSGAILHPLNKDNSTVNQENEVPLDKVYPALIQSFGIIFLGYLAAKFNVLTAIEAKGIGTFIGTFCLPALIFGSLCKLNLMSVNWGFIIALLIAKATIFFCCANSYIFHWQTSRQSRTFCHFFNSIQRFCFGKSYSSSNLFLVTSRLPKLFVPFSSYISSHPKSNWICLYGNWKTTRSSCRNKSK